MIIKDMLECAMYYLSESNCSEKQLYNYLKENFSQKDLNNNLKTTLRRLKELDLINDNRLASRIAERFSHKGDRFIVQALREQGISDEIIRTTLDYIGNEYQRALGEAKIKIRACSNESVEQTETTIMRFLSGRHFSYKTVKQVISNLLIDEQFVGNLRGQALFFAIRN